ncbi:MAG: hypothetical protein AB7L17_15295 [Ilumatobacteraceae bacterium]
MAHQTDFDLTDGYNRIVDCWYPLFGAGGQSVMPIAACAYPIDMGEHMIAVIRDQVSPEDHHLRWQMRLRARAENVADATHAPHHGEYHLYCNWQGRSWQCDAERVLFIDNAVGWVDPVGLEDEERLQVKISFGRPQFVDRVATMVVEFLVDESDEGGGLPHRMVRSFRIHADGRRDMLF